MLVGKIVVAAGFRSWSAGVRRRKHHYFSRLNFSRRVAETTHSENLSNHADERRVPKSAGSAAPESEALGFPPGRRLAPRCGVRRVHRGISERCRNDALEPMVR
jgi:hypothetical protein